MTLLPGTGQWARADEKTVLKEAMMIEGCNPHLEEGLVALGFCVKIRKGISS